MRTLGVYLIFVAIVLRTAVVVSAEPEFPLVMILLTGYGLLLFGKTWFTKSTRATPAPPVICLANQAGVVMRHKPVRQLKFPTLQLAYIFLQSVLVIGVLITASYEDFLATLFIPLSLDAVLFFGRRTGFISIAIFSLAMTLTLLFSDVGPLFGLVMGILYSGICFLFGGYAHQVQKAEATRIQNQHTFNELQVAHHQLQGYADQRASLAVERERNRLARELHDSVTQTVFSMNLATQSAHLLLDKEPVRVTGQLLHLEELAASALREIQSLVSQLTPRPIVEDGLPTALRRLVAEQKAQNGLQISLEIREEGTLSEAVTTGLYSIAHEALVNVSKHSRSYEATVRLDMGRGHSCLEIEDHGLGFDPEAALDQRGHLGLTGMYERACEIGWNLSVQSRPGQGTRIVVTGKPPGGLS
jgi:signal transduction histidine kinase